MNIDWDKIKQNLKSEHDWVDAADLGRLSIETFVAEQNPLRRDLSTGVFHFSGSGITGHAGPIDGISEALRNLQRLVAATGMSLQGHKSLRGSPPADIVAKTRLNLNASPVPGSLVLLIVPAMLPSEQIAPTGQQNLFGDTDSLLVDEAMKAALNLLDVGKNMVDHNQDEFLQSLNEFGPRVASSLRDFAEGLSKYEFDPVISWLQPRYPKITASLSAVELSKISGAIESSEKEREPITIRGILRTVSEIRPWQIETSDEQVITIDARFIPAPITSTLQTGMLLDLSVDVIEKTGPASDVQLVYVAKQVEMIRHSDI